MVNRTMRIGTVGFGGFAQFAIEQFARVEGAVLAGISGTRREAARDHARSLGIPEPQPIERMVCRDDIDLVYVATPPWLHHEHVLLALRAGKHVICEKPLAVRLEQAQEMIETARQRGLLLVADLMQRYNPLYEIVRRLVASRALGDVLHGYFENYASDEGLPPDHWFWDRERSGGIFVEHGVHFFDLFAGWLGEGRVVAAQQTARPGTGVIEQVQCTVRYDDALVNFYHGFHQPGLMDRQELRLVFERGDVVLYEWVPRHMRLHAMVNATALRDLTRVLPEAEIIAGEELAGEQRQIHARHRSVRMDRLLDLSYSACDDKETLYGQVLQAMLRDQIAWIEDRTHERVITEANGYTSLTTALAAREMAERKD